MMNFDHIEYLRHGNDKQKLVYALLIRNKILEKLHAYDPLVVGTIPIAVDTADSDVDIICYVTDEEPFLKVLKLNFEACESFKIWKRGGVGQEAMLANFIMDGLEIEIYGAAVPTRQQFAYRHMLIEHKFLAERGEAFRLEVIKLKESGIKTEPAFALLLGLQGNPYTALLELED